MHIYIIHITHIISHSINYSWNNILKDFFIEIFVLISIEIFSVEKFIC